MDTSAMWFIEKLPRGCAPAGAASAANAMTAISATRLIAAPPAPAGPATAACPARARARTATARAARARARPATARERPAERVGGAHARRCRPRPPREPQPSRRAAVVALEDRELRVRVDAGAREQPLLHPHEREIPTGGPDAPGRELRLAQS